MILLPAIDLYDNKVVRLFKGDYDQMTVYSDNPVKKALEIQSEGASWLHVVDLAGARDGTTPAYDMIYDIIQETSLNIEVGGGIRDLATIDKYLSAGVKRIIIGTKAIEDINFLKRAISKFGPAVAVSCDAKDGYLATHGWKTNSGIEITDFVKGLIKLGVSTVIATDIGKDGAMHGSNVELYKTLSSLGKINIIASGGVSSYEDIDALSEINLYGAIIGKGYYEGNIDLKKALKK